MDLMTQNSQNLALATVTRVPELYPHPPGRHHRGMTKNTLTNPSKNCRSDWGHQFRGKEREGMIRIMLQKMGGMGNASDQSIQHNIDSLKNTMINEGIAVIGKTEVNMNWININKKGNTYNRTDGWFKIRCISTGYNQVTISGGTFQSGGTAIMAVEKVSYREIGKI